MVHLMGKDEFTLAWSDKRGRYENDKIAIWPEPPTSWSGKFLDQPHFKVTFRSRTKVYEWLVANYRMRKREQRA